jgi:hypothetical protein
MKVSVTAKTIFDDRMGKLTKGQVVDLPDHKAKFYIQRGEVEYYETKVLRERPYPAAGTPLSASPVAQVSPSQTFEQSESGVKRRGRKPKGLSSPTQVSE